MCPGPLIPSPGSPIVNPRISIEDNPLTFEAKDLSGLGNEFKSRLNEITFPYEDLADFMVSNLGGNTTYKHKRVGIALPVGMQLEKTGWQLGQVGPRG